MGNHTTLKRKLRMLLGFLLVIAGVFGGIYEMLYHEHLYHVILAGVMILLGSALLAEDTVIRLVQEIRKLIVKLYHLFPWNK